MSDNGYQPHRCLKCDQPMTFVSIPNDPFGFIGVWRCDPCDIVEGDDDFLAWLYREERCGTQEEPILVDGPVIGPLVGLMSPDVVLSRGYWQAIQKVVAGFFRWL